MSLHRSSVVAIAMLAGALGSFLWFVAAADRAMDKAGFGDQGAWAVLNQHAGVAFYTSIVAWFATVLYALIKTGPERSQLLSVCAGALLLAPLAWLFVVVA